jgi:hypothetical protein
MRGNQLPVFAARWQHMLSYFYLVKNHKIADNLATTEAREEIFGIDRILEIFYVCLTKFENYQFLINKFSHRFLSATLMIEL